MTVDRSLTQQLCGWASALRWDDLPERIRGYAASQVLSQLAAARAGLSHPHGSTLVSAFGSPVQDDPRQAAVVLAGLTAWLHFDDTAYAGHLSHSTVNVPLAYARSHGLDGRALLTAVVAATECAARITASAALGPFRGQSAAFTHLAGAAAGRLHALGAPAEEWVSAFGLAFGLPPWTLMRGFLGSDSKVLSALAPVRMALDACDAAAAGFAGAPDILEHRDGFFAQFTAVPLPGTVVGDLGARWHTDTLCFKVHPGGPGMDAAVDCAFALRDELGAFGVDGIAEVVVRSSAYTLAVDGGVACYVNGADSPVSALTFSMPYTVATALLTGGLRAADFAAPATADPRRWALAAKVRVEHDPAMTRALLRAELPFGEALRAAGTAGQEWLASLGGPGLAALAADLPAPSADFRTASKVTPARVTVRLADGRELSRELAVPVGSAGSPSHSQHAALVREKFLSCGGSPAVADGVLELASASAADVARLVTAALA